MAYTVKQLSDLAGVSIRTLHYYDQIGLLKPSTVGENGYRYYEEDAVLRLQQILFFRELDLGLREIQQIMDQGNFDQLTALQAHRDGLEAKIARLRGLVQNIDSTILYLTGEMNMSKKQLFAGFSEEEEKQYAQKAREQWGSEEVDASYKRWNSYSAQKQEQIKAEGGEIYAELAERTGESPSDPAVQDLIARWHQHLRHYYEPSIGRLRGLGNGYANNPDFAQRFAELHPDLPAFLQEAIGIYCDELEKHSS